MSWTYMELRNGGFTLVDDADLHQLEECEWVWKRCGSKWVYVRESRGGTGRFLHRIIMKAPTGTEVDHINGNGLDNRRSNLRVCTHSENQQNRHRLSSASGFRGVTWHRGVRKWQAAIKKDGRNFYLGIFERPEEAARAYDQAAERLFGEFANFNFPREAA